MGKLALWMLGLALIAAACGDQTVPASGGTPGVAPAGGGPQTPAPSGYDYSGY